MLSQHSFALDYINKLHLHISFDLTATHQGVEQAQLIWALPQCKGHANLPNFELCSVFASLLEIDYWPETQDLVSCAISSFPVFGKNFSSPQNQTLVLKSTVVVQ
jgi:hypothetical protein